MGVSAAPSSPEIPCNINTLPKTKETWIQGVPDHSHPLSRAVSGDLTWEFLPFRWFFSDPTLGILTALHGPTPIRESDPTSASSSQKPEMHSTAPSLPVSPERDTDRMVSDDPINFLPSWELSPGQIRIAPPSLSLLGQRPDRTKEAEMLRQQLEGLVDLLSDTVTDVCRNRQTALHGAIPGV